MDNDQIARVMRAYGLSPGEARLTIFFASEARVFSLFEIANFLGKRKQANSDWPAVNNLIKVMISKIRSKIGKQLIANVWGIGYELTPDADLLEVLK